MKKHKLLLALVMSLMLLFTACGSVIVNSFIGTWKGDLDFTDYIVAEMVDDNAKMEQYAKFEKLTFTFVFEFTEDQISLRIDEASAQQFIANVKTGIANTVDAMVADLATQNDITPEDVFAGMNVTRETFIQSIIDSMNVDTMVNSMVASLELNGSYQVDDETITVVYDDNTYEEMKYTFDEDKLSITISDGTNNFVINCTKETE